MSKNDEGGSESQEIDFEEDLFDININNNLGQEEDSNEISLASAQDQRNKNQEILNSNHNIQHGRKLNNSIGSNGSNQHNEASYGDVVSFKEGIKVRLDSQQEVGNSNNEQIKSLTPSQKMLNQNQGESKTFDDMNLMNIFQRNQIQEQKKQSTKKSEGSSVHSGIEDGNQEKQQINNSIFNEQKNLNHNFDQEDESNLLNYQNMKNKSIFQNQNNLQQPLSISHLQYNQTNKDLLDNIQQQSFQSNKTDDVNNDQISQSSNLLDVPVFESDKYEQQMNEDIQQEQNVFRSEQNQILNKQNQFQSIKQNLHLIQDDSEDDDDDEDDIDNLIKFANNYSNSQKEKIKEESIEGNSESKQEILIQESKQSQIQNQIIQENNENNSNILNETQKQQQNEIEKSYCQQNNQQIQQDQKNRIIDDHSEQYIKNDIEEQQFQDINDKNQNKKQNNNQMEIEEDNTLQEGKRDIGNAQDHQEKNKQQQEGRIENNEITIKTEQKDQTNGIVIEKEKKQGMLQENQQELIEKNKDNGNLIQNNHNNQVEEKNNKQTESKFKENEKSISEAPQTIASILQQLSQVFSKMIIPQSMINMSLHHDKTIQSTEFKTSANMQEQMNQLQNQVTSIQNSVMHIPHHLSEVSQLLCKAATTGITGQIVPLNIAQTPATLQKSSQQPSMEQETKIIAQTKKEEQKKPTKESEKPKKKEETSEESEEENESDEESEEKSEEEEEDEEEEESDEEDLSDIKKISSKFQKASNFGKDSMSKGSQQSFGSSTFSKKTSYIQPKNSFSAPKTITPIKPLSQSLNQTKNENPQESQADAITINAASIGFKEPKLFINESDRVQKSDDLEIEDDNLKPLYEYLNKLDQPSSFLIIKEQFPNLTDEQIHTIIDEFRSEEKIGIVQLFLPKYAKCNSARIDYYYVDMIIPPPKPKQVEEEVTEELKENNQEKNEMKLENVGDRKKFEAMTDEQLLSYQKELNLRKQALVDKKQNANPTSDRIKKIQQWNEMKEVCSTVFERIAVAKGKRIQEICEDFGVKLDE